MRLVRNSYNSQEDYWRIREFLRQVMLRNNRRDWSWHVSRWDFLFWSLKPAHEQISFPESVFIWETETGQIAAVLHPEDRGSVFLQIHPDYCCADLEEEMLCTAENHLTSATLCEVGKPRIWIWTESKDISLHEMLARRGYHRIEQEGAQEYKHRSVLDQTLPECQLAPGYTIRALGDGLELLERCYAAGLAFRGDDATSARARRDHPEWYRSLQSAPLYRRDLDLVVTAPDGCIASFCTIWFDDVTRTACFEPVGTVPAHQRRGLARAMMTDGLHRLKRMGCMVAYVSGFSTAANALYSSAMRGTCDVAEPWEKVFD